MGFKTRARKIQSLGHLYGETAYLEYVAFDRSLAGQWSGLPSAGTTLERARKQYATPIGDSVAAFLDLEDNGRCPVVVTDDEVLFLDWLPQGCTSKSDVGKLGLRVGDKARLRTTIEITSGQLVLSNAYQAPANVPKASSLKEAPWGMVLSLPSGCYEVFSQRRPASLPGEDGHVLLGIVPAGRIAQTTKPKKRLVKRRVRVTRVQHSDELTRIIGSKRSPKAVRKLSIDLDGGSLPEDFSLLTNIQELALLGVCKVPEQLRELRTLISLSMNCAEITKLPSWLVELSQLRELSCFRSYLRALPNNIGDLVHLRDINVSDTDISRLPESIWDLTELRELRLSGSPIKTLSPKVSQLEKLRLLWINRTEIRCVPYRELGTMKRLMSLRISEEGHDTGLEAFSEARRSCHVQKQSRW